LAVLHDSGFALRNESEIAASGDLKLESWGRVEGTIRVGNRDAAGEAIRLTVHQEGRGDEPRPYFDYRAAADAQGHYVIERVPPGKVYASARSSTPIG
jgi:hypothetical protein